MERKNESAMVGYLRGVTKQLCKINPEGIGALKKHIETLQSFRNVISDAAALDGGESGYEDAFESLDEVIQERMEECAERIDEIASCPKVKDEKRCISYEIGELSGVSAELSAIHIKLIQAQARLKERMPHDVALVVATKHLKALEDTLHDAGLMADGIISRFESIENGVFDK